MTSVAGAGDDGARSRSSRPVVVGLAVVLVLIAAAALVPALTGWEVRVHSPPLTADWLPRVGPGTVPALAVAAAVLTFGPRVAQTWSWPRLLIVGYATTVAWSVALATVDGWAGIGEILQTPYEYLPAARQVTDVSVMLTEFVDRIPFSHPDNWPVHVAGHPAGALLFFVALVRLGLGSGLAAGWVVLLLGATTPIAVLATMRRLGAADHARRAAPFLVVGPSAIWMAVSADALFAAVAAWAVMLLACAATARSRGWTAAWGLAAGVLFGCCVMLSYGLLLLGVLAVAVLVIARSWRPLVWAMAGALAVVLVFAVAGFVWWEAYPVLVDRYWDGIASGRPGWYWTWADLAALAISAGPVVGPAVALAATRARSEIRGTSPVRTVTLLVLAATAMVLLATISQMSRAEVERIWLPFIPWLLVGTALLPRRWVGPLLAVQLIAALVVQHLFATSW